MIHFFSSISKVLGLLTMCWCVTHAASQAPAQDTASQATTNQATGPAAATQEDAVSPSSESLPTPLFGERTEDQVERLLANAPPGEHDGSQTGLKAFVAERFSTGHQVAFFIASCASLCLLLPGAFLVFSCLQRSMFAPERMVSIAAILSLLSLAWILFIYSLAFSRNAHSYDVQQREVQVIDRETAPGNLFIGDLNHAALKGLLSEWGGGLVRHPLRRAGDTVPHSLFMIFQLTVFLQAVIPLLAVANRQLNGWSTFVLLLAWSVLVYAPLCYWTRGGGWLADCVDAGGSVSIHIAVGFTALGLSWFRLDSAANRPTDIREAEDNRFQDKGVGSNRDALQRTQANSWLIIAGGLMYLAGSLLVAGCRSVSSAPWPTFDFVNIFVGSVTGLLMWLLIAQRSSTVMPTGWPLGMIAGVVSVTAGCASVTPTSTIVVSTLGTLACCIAVSLGGNKNGSSVSASWLLFAVFGVSGVVGVALTGVFASPEIAGADIAGKPIVGVIAGNHELVRLQVLVAAVASVVASVAGLVLPYISVLIGFVLERIFASKNSVKRIRDLEAPASV